MKNIIVSVIAAILLVLCCSCADPDNSLPTDSDENYTEQVSASENTETATENIETAAENADTNEETITNDIPNADMGIPYDLLSDDYTIYYSDINSTTLSEVIDAEKASELIKNVGTDYFEKYNESYGTGIFSRPSILAHFAQKSGIEKSELTLYIKKLIDNYGMSNYPNSELYCSYTEEDIEALLSEDWKAAMPNLKSPYAFLYEDKIYTVYALYNMRDSEEFQVFVKDDTYKAEWNAIKAYFEDYYSKDSMYQTIGYSQDMVDFVNKYAD